MTISVEDAPDPGSEPGDRPGGGARAADPHRRLTALLLAVAVAVGSAACDVVRDLRAPGPAPSSSPPVHRVEKKAPNPPPGLPAQFTSGQRLHWANCPPPSAGQSGGSALGQGWECTSMKAPLDYRKPGGDAIDVALIRRLSTGPEDKRIGSLVFDFGGPGASGTAGLPEFAAEYTPLLGRYDLVGFDPRGVGRTIPVSCAGFSYDGPASCKKHSGKWLPYVSTSQTARDMDLMRYLLGDTKLYYFGVSYGTTLGGVYAHLFPRHVGRLVLEAPVDPTQTEAQKALSQVRAVQGAFDRFTRYCAEEYKDCPTGSDPKAANQRAAELVNNLDNHPVRVNGDELTGSLAAHAISNFLDRGRDGWPPLVKALDEVVHKHTGNLLYEQTDGYDTRHGSRARPAATVPGSVKVPDDNEFAANISITCADDNTRPDFDDTYRLSHPVAQASPVFGDAWFTTATPCVEWPVPGEAATPDVSTEGAAPILVVAGTGDPTTPYAGGRRMAGELGRGVGILLTVKAEGHGTYPQNLCATRAVDAYLLAGKLPNAGAVCS